MDEVKSLASDHVKVEIRVVVPGNISGDDVGMLAMCQQYLAEWEFSPDVEFALLSTLQRMSRQIADKIMEKMPSA